MVHPQDDPGLPQTVVTTNQSRRRLVKMRRNKHHKSSNSTSPPSSPTLMHQGRSKIRGLRTEAEAELEAMEAAAFFEESSEYEEDEHHDSNSPLTNNAYGGSAPSSPRSNQNPWLRGPQVASPSLEEKKEPEDKDANHTSDSLNAASHFTNTDKSVSFAISPPRTKGQPFFPRQPLSKTERLTTEPVALGSHQDQKSQGTQRRRQQNSFIASLVGFFPSSELNESDNDDNHQSTERQTTERTPLMLSPTHNNNHSRTNNNRAPLSPPPLLDPEEFPDSEDWDEMSQVSRQYSSAKVERFWGLVRQKVLSGEYLLERQRQQGGEGERWSGGSLGTDLSSRRQSTASAMSWNTTPWLQASWSNDESPQQRREEQSLMSRSHSHDDNSEASIDFYAGSTRTVLTRSQRHFYRQRKQQAIQVLLNFSLGQCIAVMVLYMCLSVVAFSFLFDTQWTFIDSMYFALVTCTTIGYGDLVPETTAGRIFTIVYALTGVCFLGIALGILGNHIVETQEAAVEQTSIVAKRRLLSLFSSADSTSTITETRNNHQNDKPMMEKDYPMTKMPSMTGGVGFSNRRMSAMSALTTDVGMHAHRHSSLLEEVQEQDLFADDPEVLANAVPGVEAKNLQDLNGQSNKSNAKRAAATISNLLFHFVLVMVLLAIFALLIERDPGVEAPVDVTSLSSLLSRVNASLTKFLDALYFSIVTSTTVGYGDFAPVSQQGRLLTIFFIPLAVGAMGHFLSSVAEAIMDTRARTVRQKLAMQELSPEDLEIMDLDGDGVVTRAEFLEYMLVALNKVDKEFIEELRDHFKRLDVDGTGSLSKNDLIEQARKKLQRIHHKLDLCNYKQDLLRKAAAARAHRRRRSANLWGSLSSRSMNGTDGNPIRSFTKMVHRSTRHLSIFSRGDSFGDYHKPASHQRSQSMAAAQGLDRRQREPFPDRRRQPVPFSIPASSSRHRNAFRDASKQLSEVSLSVNYEVSEEYQVSFSSDDDYSNGPVFQTRDTRSGISPAKLLFEDDTQDHSGYVLGGKGSSESFGEVNHHNENEMP